MELIFLEKSNLLYKDYGYCDNDFEIDLDIVVIKKSTFIVNKININTSVGDIVILRDKEYFYIGITQTIEVADIYKTKIQCVDFKEIFNIDIPVRSYSGDIAAYLVDLINNNLISSSDPIQNLPFLTISKETSIDGTLTFDIDKIMSIQSIIELISKSYGVSVKFEVQFLRGRITGIRIRIVDVKSGIKLKSNLSYITDLIISNSSSQLINKVIYYPKESNEKYKSPVEFYLLKTGEVTQDKENDQRYENVNLKSFIFSDSDYPTLSEKAKSEMISSKLDHNITFNLNMDNSIIKPLDNINIGDFIEFFTDNKSYETVITALKFKNGFNICSLTLGEYRIKLTEKIQLLNKTINQTASNISIQTNSNTIDGGEF